MLAGKELIEKSWKLPNHLRKIIQTTVFQFRGGETWYKEPSALQVQTLAHLVQTNKPHLGCVNGSEWARLEPRSRIRQLADDRVVCPNFWRQRHPLTYEVETYVKERIKISDLCIRGSLQQSTGDRLDSTTAGRLLLLKKIMDNEYDPLLGITTQEAERWLSDDLACQPLVRLKRDLNICGFHNLAREIDPNV
jgi:hypothetical protein